MSLLGLFQHAENAQTFPAGSIIFAKGESGANMYVLIEGTLEIRVGDTIVERVEPGNIVGEMALIEPNSPRSATVIAMSSCRLAPVNAERFMYLVQQTPFFALEVMRMLADRLRRMDRKILER